ncbi:SH3 domain-containing protein [Tropicimonas sp. IMCC6043]|uniref:SH3 domain-containing protein n=1 Tax=Tropicimonas sp. IMCC6043 TaxID=2510645 RepID=UPI00101DA81E|nr:SH3 domain-containing protein [Tropicimonas sp. IMCC6043]RYH08412.1 SH3 domain-containing protein [Tropicimonas sp. IMCC6043]
MRIFPKAALAALLLAAGAAGAAPLAEVTGVDQDDMLKLRSGPGTGYRVVVGLPNGTMVRNHGCDRVGGTPWCKVSLRDVRQLKGYVSGHYLKDQPSR